MNVCIHRTNPLRDNLANRQGSFVCALRYDFSVKLLGDIPADLVPIRHANMRVLIIVACQRL